MTVENELQKTTNWLPHSESKKYFPFFGLRNQNLVAKPKPADQFWGNQVPVKRINRHRQQRSEAQVRYEPELKSGVIGSWRAGNQRQAADFFTEGPSEGKFVKKATHSTETQFIGVQIVKKKNFRRWDFNVK